MALQAMFLLYKTNFLRMPTNFKLLHTFMVHIPADLSFFISATFWKTNAPRILS